MPEDVVEPPVQNDSQRIQELERELSEKNSMIETLCQQIDEMKSSYCNLLDSSTGGGSIKLEPLEPIKPQESVGEVPIKDDEGYFNTYAHFDIHHDMLSVSSLKIKRKKKTTKIYFNFNPFSGYSSYKQLL